MRGERVIKPPRLKKGGTVAVIAPSSYPEYPKFSLYEGIEYVRYLGFRVSLGKTLTSASSRWYLSGDDKVRAEEVNWAFKDDKVDAIFCARGGVGSLRILSLLDYELIRNHPKPFIGYSDTTAIQNAIFNLTGLISIQGPMVAVGLGKEPDVVRRFKGYWERLMVMLAGEQLSLGAWRGGPAPLTIRGGKATGRLVGGNLILFALMNGSKYMPTARDRVLFLEDIEEQAWRVDNYMASLQASGYLDEVGSVVLGEFPREPEEVDPVKLEELFMSYLGSKPYPSFLNYPCCHGFGREPLPIGIRMEVDADSKQMVMREATTE